MPAVAGLKLVGVFPAGPRLQRDRIPDFGWLSGGAFAGDDEHWVRRCLAACTSAPRETSNERVIALTVKRCFTAALVANGRLWRVADILIDYPCRPEADLKAAT
jgi:hypothetical protein